MSWSWPSSLHVSPRPVQISQVQVTAKTVEISEQPIVETVVEFAQFQMIQGTQSLCSSRLPVMEAFAAA